MAVNQSIEASKGNGYLEKVPKHVKDLIQRPVVDDPHADKAIKGTVLTFAKLFILFYKTRSCI